MFNLTEEQLALLDDQDLAAFTARYQWLQQARPKQLLPDGDWDTIVYIAGRFFGKTRTIVEPTWWKAFECPGIRIHALAPTLGDVRRTLFEGESGFLAKIPAELVKQVKQQDKEIIFHNGSKIFGFSVVEEAERLRGPQCHWMIFDEAAAADRPQGNLEAAYRVAALGCRLPLPDGTPSRKLIATTPRPIKFLKDLMKRPGVITVHGTSHENLRNVSEAARRELMSLEGTTYGKQEIYGQFIDEDSELSIIKRDWIKLWPANKKLPTFNYILECYDTATSEHQYNAKKHETDPSASIILGIFDVLKVFSPLERRKYGLKGQYAALLCDYWSEHLGLPDLLERARKQHATKWGSPPRRADIVLIEDKSSGPSLRQFLQKYSVPVWPYNPGRESKTMRLHAVSPLLAQNLLFVPESMRPDMQGQPRDWVAPFLEQLCAYAGPGSTAHDETVDLISSSFSFLRDRGMLEATPVDEYVDKEDRIRHDRIIADRSSRNSRLRPIVNPYG